MSTPQPWQEAKEQKAPQTEASPSTAVSRGQPSTLPSTGPIEVRHLQQNDIFIQSLPLYTPFHQDCHIISQANSLCSYVSAIFLLRAPTE